MSRKLSRLQQERNLNPSELPTVPDAFMRTEYEGWLEERIKRFQLRTYQKTQSDQMWEAIIPASELQNLPDYKLYVRTMLKGQPLEPFLVQSAPPLTGFGKPADATTVVRTSLVRYGRKRATVEQRLKRVLSSTTIHLTNAAEALQYPISFLWKTSIET